MRMTTKGQYALVALAHIKKKNDLGFKSPVKLEDIAQAEVLPGQYLEQLFRKLRVAGIVSSTRGPGGGYTIIKDPITYKDVLEAVGETMSFRSAICDKSSASSDVIANLNTVYSNLTKDLELKII